MVDWHKNLYPYLQICSALRGVKLESVLPKNLYYMGSKGKSVENLWISFERWTWKTFENSTFLGIFLWFIYKMIEKSLGWIFFSSEVPYCTAMDVGIPTDISSRGSFRSSKKGRSHGTLELQVHKLDSIWSLFKCVPFAFSQLVHSTAYSWQIAEWKKNWYHFSYPQASPMHPTKANFIFKNWSGRPSST